MKCHMFVHCQLGTKVARYKNLADLPLGHQLSELHCLTRWMCGNYTDHAQYQEVLETATHKWTREYIQHNYRGLSPGSQQMTQPLKPVFLHFTTKAICLHVSLRDRRLQRSCNHQALSEQKSSNLANFSTKPSTSFQFAKGS